MARHRKGKIKTEHGIMEGLMPILERLAEEGSIQTIIPGRIVRAYKGGGTIVAPLKMKISNYTPSGLRLQACTARYAQEIFVATAKPDVVKDLVMSLWVTKP